VLDNGFIRRVGDASERQVDVRVVAATHRDLGAAVVAGRFRDAVDYVAATADGPEVGPDDLPGFLQGADPVAGDASIAAALAAVERRRISEALAAEAGHQSRAAARLGMARRTFLRRMKQYGIPGRRGG